MTENNRVEYLGSGMPRILKAYSKDTYTFSSHFIRTCFPVSEAALSLEQEVSQTDKQASGVESEMALKILALLKTHPLSKADIAKALGKEKPTRYLNELMKKLITNKQVAYTIPEKPNSRLQKYQLTSLGLEVLKNLTGVRHG